MSTNPAQHVCSDLQYIFDMAQILFTVFKTSVLFCDFFFFLDIAVMKVIATDDDEANTDFSSIFYKIEEQSNLENMFYINSKTGIVSVLRSTLDREVSLYYFMKSRKSLYISLTI